MSTTEVTTQNAGGDAKAPKVPFKFEAVVIPVTDVDRAKGFYADLGWETDADFAFDNGFRVVQFTPPGSGGVNWTTRKPLSKAKSASSLHPRSA